jgi:uncharacterized protein (TIGR03086 family)
MSTEGLAKSHAAARAALAGVSSDQLDQPTPCASWTVRDVANHLVGGNYWFAASVNGDAAPESDDAPDFAAGDLVAAFDESSRQAIEAFDAPGALEKMVTLPFGTMPGGAFMGLATTDQFTHAWDLARATGQQIDFDQDHAEALLAASKASIQDAFRGPDGQAPFGPAVDVADDAPAADRLAAFLGRQV